jgi:hypothetical protein
MSADRTETEYHLTPSGWLEGSFWVYSNKAEDVPTLADRVETWIKEVDDTSGWAPPVVSWKKVWESTDVTPNTKSELSLKFPRPEHPTWKPYQKKRRKLADCD